MKYTWMYDGDVETFFKRLRSVTIARNSLYNQWSWERDCFILDQKPRDRFMLWYHKSCSKNSFSVILFGSVKKTPTGVAVDASLRMALPVYPFLTIWFGVLSIAFLLAAISLSPMAIGIGAFLFAGFFMVKRWRAYSNPKGIVALMNKLKNVKLPIPKPAHTPR